MREVAAHETLLASAIVTKYVTFRKVPTNNIYNTKTKIYFLRSWPEFAILQSSHHQEWAFWTCGTLGASTLNYSTSYALETWAMPALGGSGELESLGKRYHAHREFLMSAEAIGLTQLYNRFHDQSDNDPRIETMRELHREIDHAVARAYGWNDLDLQHGFHEVPYLPENDRARFTISESARVEVLRRLSELNHQRYEEEVAQGLHGKTKPRTSTPKRRRTSTDVPQPSFDFDTPPANEGQYLKVAEPRPDFRAGPAHAIVEYLKAHPGWHAKSDILAATGITDGQWNTAITDLISVGKVERQGERRGTRYRLIE
jgi:hypothetical protein